jgi:TonB family protein
MLFSRTALLALLGAFPLWAAAQQTTPPPTASNGEPVYSYVEKMPTFRGSGPDSIVAHLKRNLHYPPEAFEQRIEGRVFVNFVVSTTGAVEQVKVSKSVHPLLDAEAIRVVQSMPAWEPGQQAGRPVNVSYTLPLTFRLPAVQQLATGQRPEAEGTPARPVGGQSALLAYLKDKGTYPEAALQKKASGIVFVRVEIDSLGHVTKTKSVASLGLQDRGNDKQPIWQKQARPELISAAETLLTSGLTWQPALKKGHPRKGTQFIPVTFDAPTNSVSLMSSIHLFPDKVAAIPGGTAAFGKFMGQNIRYPVAALRSKTEGKVLIWFQVSEEGWVENPVVISSVSPECDAEALRVVAMSPPLFPALENGRPVRSHLVVPVSYKIK